MSTTVTKPRTFADRAVEPVICHGWPVFPCRPDNKRPLVEGGFHAATTDLAQIEAWSQEWPAALIGIPCGPETFDVLDIDVRDGKEGAEWLKVNAARLPKTRIIRTRSGGVHLYMAPNPAMRSTAGAIAPGVDTRAANTGYVVAWNVEGLPVKNPSTFAEWPAWLVADANRGRAAGAVTGEKAPLADRLPPSAAAVVDVLDRMSNPAATTRDTYIAVAMATRGCAQALDDAGADGAEQIGDAWARWAERWEDYAGTDEQARWDSDFASRDSITGWSHLQRHAERLIPGYREEVAAGHFADSPLPAEPVTMKAAAARKLPILQMGAFDDMPDPVFTVDALLPEQSLVAVYGPPKQGKTFLTLSLAMHIAAGFPWFGRTVRQGAVVYIAGEGAGGLKHRIRAMRQHHDIPATAPFYVIPRAVNFTDKAAVAEMVQAVREVAGDALKLLVIDTLARATPGMDENSAGDMGRVIAECDRIKETFGCTVLVVHHSGKDAGKGGRGSSALPGAVDASFIVTRDKTETSDIVTLANEFQKDAEEAGPMHFDLEHVETGNKHGSLVPVFRPEGVAKQVKLTAAQSAAMGHLSVVMAGGDDVDEELWREACAADGAVSSATEPRDRKKAFFATVSNLVKAGRVSRGGGRVWLGCSSGPASGSDLAALGPEHRERGSKREISRELPLPQKPKAGGAGATPIGSSHLPPGCTSNNPAKTTESDVVPAPAATDRRDPLLALYAATLRKHRKPVPVEIETAVRRDARAAGVIPPETTPNT